MGLQSISGSFVVPTFFATCIDDQSGQCGPNAQYEYITFYFEESAPTDPLQPCAWQQPQAGTTDLEFFLDGPAPGEPNALRTLIIPYYEPARKPSCGQDLSDVQAELYVSYFGNDVEITESIIKSFISCEAYGVDYLCYYEVTNLDQHIALLQ